MSNEPAPNASDPTPSDPTPAESTLVTADPAPSPADPADPADPNAADPNADPADPVDPNAADPNADDPNKAKDEGAPDEYAEFAMPEGIALDAELADQFKATAKELNLTQEQAQKVIDLGAQMRQRDVETIINLRKEWVDQTKADKDIGGDKLDATLGVAKRAIDAYGSENFVKLLNETGLGNHPEVVRFMAKAGRAVSEDSVVRGSDRTKPHTRSLAERLYGPKE
jgi:hypothetical protein